LNEKKTEVAQINREIARQQNLNREQDVKHNLLLEVEKSQKILREALIEQQTRSINSIFAALNQAFPHLNLSPDDDVIITNHDMVMMSREDLEMFEQNLDHVARVQSAYNNRRRARYQKRLVTRQEVLKVCGICSEPFVMKELMGVMACKHIFHTDCLDSWLQFHSRCALCNH
jgi:hypothetical protein